MKTARLMHSMTNLLGFPAMSVGDNDHHGISMWSKSMEAVHKTRIDTCNNCHPMVRPVALVFKALLVKSILLVAE